MSDGIPFKLKRRSWREVMPHFIPEVEAEIQAAVLAERQRCIQDQCSMCDRLYKNYESVPIRSPDEISEQYRLLWQHHGKTGVGLVRPEICDAQEIHERVYQEELKRHERARQEQA